MAQLFDKIRLKGLRTIGSSKLVSIKRGLLKGAKWSVSIPDSRYISGVYEEDLAKRVKQAVESGKRFVDIGANAGYFSMIASKYGNQEIKHIAIEPFPANVEFLSKHLMENAITNVLIVDIAISDRNGEIEFSNTDNLAANTYKSESSIFQNDVIKVRTESLDSFAKRQGLESDCFIKIDVEGAELDVLIGGQTYLKEFKPNIVLATHDCHVPGVKNECLNLLTSIGYQTEILEDTKIDGQEDFLCTYPLD